MTFRCRHPAQALHPACSVPPTLARTTTCRILLVPAKGHRRRQFGPADWEIRRVTDLVQVERVFVTYGEAQMSDTILVQTQARRTTLAFRRKGIPPTAHQ
jgi:hypothetical protein